MNTAKTSIRLSLIAIASFFALQPALAHEYYLLPETFAAKTGAKINVRHRLGQRFNGNEMPYITPWNVRSELWDDGKMRPVKGKDGDRPALKLTISGQETAIIVHESNVEIANFKTWEKFTTYVLKEGLDHALQASERGEKPKAGLKEAYTRFAKTLVILNGSKTALDRPTGLKIELVAKANPLALPTNKPMPVQVLYNGKPLAGASVKVFAGIDTEHIGHFKSDENGMALIPAKGPGPYLLNAIHMTEPQSQDAKSKKAHWESFWASLTFSRAN